MRKRYDALIVGAGIGGLVCGCRLAQAGLHVAVLERHHSPGGYCTSFNRKGYRFDVGVHYLGGIEKGILGRILDELDIKKRLRLNRFDPTDKIVLPGCRTYIRTDDKETREEFIKNFPKEKDNIREFFAFLGNSDFLHIYARTGRVSFKTILDEFFTDRRLKATLGLLSGNIGLPPAQISALSAVMLFREFILDPGYYPSGGMSAFAGVLADQFKEYGGELLLNREVTKIEISQNRVTGLILEDGESLGGEFVVSNADAFLTFQEMIDRDTPERETLHTLEPSPSLAVLYLGVKDTPFRETCNTWKSTTTRLNRYFDNFEEHVRDLHIPFYVVSFPGCHDPTRPRDKQVVQVYTSVPYVSAPFWKSHSGLFAKKMIAELERAGIVSPGSIEVKETATPPTFQRYTLNHMGAAYGWASTVDQVNPSIFPQGTSINGLYLAGHWCTLGNGQGGISRVAFSGKRAAEMILKKMKKREQIGA